MSEIRQPIEPSAQADVIDMEEARRLRRMRRLFKPYAIALAQQKGQRRRATPPRMAFDDIEPHTLTVHHRRLSRSAIDAAVRRIARRKRWSIRWQANRLLKWLGLVKR